MDARGPRTTSGRRQPLRSAQRRATPQASVPHQWIALELAARLRTYLNEHTARRGGRTWCRHLRRQRAPARCARRAPAGRRAAPEAGNRFRGPYLARRGAREGRAAATLRGSSPSVSRALDPGVARVVDRFERRASASWRSRASAEDRDDGIAMGGATRDRTARDSARGYPATTGRAGSEAPAAFRRQWLQP